MDVSNDTVVVTKPKVEILPIAESGLVPVRDIEHFRATAQSYWGAAIYANHLVPSLAPLLPMISASPGRLKPGMQSACDYMIALMCRDGFRQAEDWLRDGPSPSPEIAAAVLASVPPTCAPGPPTAGPKRSTPAAGPAPPAVTGTKAGATCG
ncbi:hypothetical protein [Skermanella pratensis]|uniref:hypothetical protein n=1 Tax=Skermanella pratensis TaxID=2233999 RepID=UPI001FE667B1|nr:hypothetical protein [Skermanella pratensis]